MDRSKSLRALMKEKKRSLESLGSSRESLDTVKKNKPEVAPFEKLPPEVKSTLSFRETNSATVSAVEVAPKSLPVGFFDDPFKDSYARGVDPIKLLNEDKQKEAEKVSSFLSEVKQLDYLEATAAMNQPVNTSISCAESAEQSEEEVREVEEEVVQMAYMVHLANLYQKASQVGAKGKKPVATNSSSSSSSSGDIAYNDADISEEYRQAENLRHTLVPDAVAENTFNKEAEHKPEVSNDGIDIGAILASKRKNRKSSLNTSSGVHFEAFDVMNDWTSKSYG